jgi:hypothetical protein
MATVVDGQPGVGHVSLGHGDGLLDFVVEMTESIAGPHLVVDV